MRIEMVDLVLDAALLRRFRDGDPEVLAAVYQDHVDDIHRVVAHGFLFRSRGRVFRFTGLSSQSDQMDAAQEVFCRAFTEGARRSYQGQKPYRAYLHTIAYHVLIDQARGPRIVPLLGQEGTAPEMEARSHGDPGTLAERPASPEEAVEWNELAASLQGLVGGLPAAEGRVLDARYAEGLSEREAAARLQMSRGQVRRHEERGLGRLRHRLRLLGFLRLPRGPDGEDHD
jgi:RNA polymerase sigma factor (sigma-70 family)